MSSWHDMGCSCCADNWTDEGILGNEDLNQYIVRRPARAPPRVQ